MLNVFNLKQDGKILKNVSLQDVDEKIAVDKSFLAELGAKNCSDESRYCISDMGTNVTDLSIWSTSLSTDEMISWTKCRL